MKSTKLATHALAAFIAIVITGLMIVGIDSLAAYCGAGTAGSSTVVAKSVPALHKGVTMWTKT